MEKFEIAIKERLETRRLEEFPCTTGSDHCYLIDDDEKIFVKTGVGEHAALMLDGELESLKTIRTNNTLRVPKPHLTIHEPDGAPGSALVVEYLDIEKALSPEAAKLLASQLVDMHVYNRRVIKYNKRATNWVGKKVPSRKLLESLTTAVPPSSDDEETSNSDNEAKHFTKHQLKTSKQSNCSGTVKEDPSCFVPRHEQRYPVEKHGFHVPTCCGSIPQINEWTEDWVSFYARYRLDSSIRQILSDHGDRQLSEQWSHLQLKVQKFFSDFTATGENSILPALLHGDLWSGNVGQIKCDQSGTTPVVYDPSSFYGHWEYEFGIVRMFRGFPKEFEEEYFGTIPKPQLFERRNKLYQLFHHLNHWNHFGSGYKASSLYFLKELNSLV